MRVLLTLHHHFDPNLGAPGATLALGDALQRQGCSVAYWGFERAFPGHASGWGVKHAVQFPWRTAAFLRRHARDYDVIDASTGDAWLWAVQGRPGAGANTVLMTRSHGLEHTADRQVRAEARANAQPLSWKYPVYHGGWRLNEVAISLRLADGCLLLNDADRDFARDTLKVAAQKMTITPMGVADYFFDRESFTAPLPPTPAFTVDRPLRLAYLSSWIPRKGSSILVTAMESLAEQGVPFELTAYGTGAAGQDQIRAAFPAAIRERVHVVPRFEHRQLPDLLHGTHVLLFPSFSEGFSRALVEAMACGLAPVATAVGGAPAVIRDGENGLLIPPGDAAALAAAVRRLIDDGPTGLDKMRQRARETSADYRWETIARQTIAAYERAGARWQALPSASASASVDREAVLR